MALLDVREEWETQLAPGTLPLVHIPMGQIPTGWANWTRRRRRW